jgi:exopolysaccharide biosynthesis polyprenyl glycosylphosphotransferase
MASGVAGRESSLGRTRSRLALKARYAPTLGERRVLLFLADQIALLLGILLSQELAGIRAGNLESALAMMAFVVIWWVAASAFDSYEFRRVANPLKSVVAVWAALGVTIVAIVVFNLVIGGRLSLSGLISFAALSAVLLASARLCYAVALTTPDSRRRAIVVGRGAEVADAVQDMQADAATEYEVVGVVSTSPLEDQAVMPILGAPGSLARLVLLHGVDDVILAAGESDEVANEAIRALRSAEPGVGVVHFAALYEQLRGRVFVRYVCPHWQTLLEARANASAFLVIKRAMDLVGSALALVVLAPLFGAIALAIRLDGSGPIIYRQQREGLHGRIFTMLKFRTMIVDAEAGDAIWEGFADPRRTRVGRILRPLHLDEIPQLVNVLEGSMSLVGPRPERSHFVAQLERISPAYRDRMLVRPGITGWAQVRYGYARSLEESVEKLEHDLYYVKHWSPFLDLVIALKTVGAFARRSVNQAPHVTVAPTVESALSGEAEVAPASASVASS